MNINKRVSDLERLLADQQKIINRQQIQLRKTQNKLKDLNLKLLSVQSSVISKDTIPKISPVEFISNKNSDVAVYSFGGMETRLGMPPAEFMRSLESFDVEQVFFKDFFQCWYQKGLLSYTDNLIDTIEWLKNFKKENGHEKVITVGTSAGAYAAIVFGVAIKARKIIAFGPQTKIETKIKNRLEIKKQWYDTHKLFLDLNVFLSNQKEIPPIEIYFGEQCLPDKVEAENIENYKEVCLYPVKDTHSHAISKVLKDRGELGQILQNAFSQISE